MLLSDKKRLELAARPDSPTPPAQGKARRAPRLSDQLTPSLRVRIDADMGLWRQAETQALSPYRPRREALMLLYRQAMKDNYLSGQIGTLKNKVLSEPFALVDEKGKENADALKLFQRPWFMDFMNRVLDTDFWGHTLLCFDNPATEGEHAGEFERLDIIPRAQVVPEWGQVLLSVNDAVGLPYRGVEADYTQLLLEVALKDEEGGYALGILNKAVPEIIWKRFARADWSRRSEKYGMPMLALKTDVIEESELREKERALANMGSNGYMVIDTAEDIEFKESSNQDGSKMYQALADFVNNELGYLISGQTATSQETGSRAGGEVHERVQEHYVQARMRFLYFFVNFELFPFLKKWGYQLDGLTWQWRKMLDEEQARLNPPAPPVPPTPTGDDDPTADPEKDTPPPPNAKKKAPAKPGKPAKAKSQPLAASGPALTLAGSPTLTGLFNEVVAKLHADRPALKQMLKSKPWQAMMRETGRQLLAAAEQGYGHKLADLAGGTPDAQLLEKFADNLYVFSAQKNYDLLVQLNRLLLTDDGQIRPFGDFQQKALVIDETYNKTWLQTEYETAVATAQMARKWQGFQQGNPDKYYLKYSTVGDSLVRPQHQELDGITLPLDDPFWNSHTPPLGFKCRCTLVRVPRAGRAATPAADLSSLATTATAGFGHNATKNGVIFPEGRQYANVPKDVKPLLEKLGIQGRLASGYQRAHTDKASGGTVDVHHAHGGKELDRNLATAKFLAARGERVRLLPNPNSVSADATRNGVEWEFKDLTDYKNLAGRISKELTAGRKQASRLLLNLTGHFTAEQAGEGMNRAVRNNKAEPLIAEVAIQRNGQLRSFTREQIAQRDFGSLDDL